MTEKNQTFAFIVGEVAPAFYGRLDLQRYPLGLAVVENFFIDYHGGLYNRPGSRFIGMLANQVHRLTRFRARDYDLTLFFTDEKMRVLRDEKFVHTAADAAGNIAAGVVTAANTLVVGQLAWVSDGIFEGYFSVTARTSGTFTISSPIGQVVPDGAVTWAPVYELATGITATELSAMKFAQDLDTIVATVNTQLPCFLRRVADDNWVVSTFANSLPAAPTGLVGIPSGAGSSSVGFVVTAVVGGVESAASVELVTTGIANYSVTTGHFTLSWTAVSGAERYNVYRSLVYPTTYPAGAQLGYVGYTQGTSFVDMNVTADYTKALPLAIDFFAGNNFPAVYSRFQQRGVYGGLANEPLTVVGSIGTDKGRFSISFPTNATDSYSYTIDAQSERPIKHMLPLRYGLMLFTDDGITQLRGGDNVAISAVAAVAETQGYMSVSDLEPVAINLDVLFMTTLNSELNQMVYTEYTNSFKMQDILVLSSHLFSVDYPAIRVDWAAEPHKMLHFVREDGQKVVMTYERNLEVYGWARYRTRGDYLDLCVVREADHNLCYQTVRRCVNGTEVMFIEREQPRYDTGYSRMWYVDGGTERKLLRPAVDITLVRQQPDTEDDYLEALWHLTASDITWATVDDVVYAGQGMFRIDSVETGYVVLAPMYALEVSTFYQKDRVVVPAGDWGYNTPVTSVSGLWWLEGETVSILHDGDATLEATVVNGTVTVFNAAAHFTVGLPYASKMQSLPLSLPNYILGGTPMALRGVALRQNNSRGLSIGGSFDNMQELPSRRDENWNNPLKLFSELTIEELWGGGGWDEEVSICMEQTYPLPAMVLGFTYDLDLGE